MSLPRRCLHPQTPCRPHHLPFHSIPYHLTPYPVNTHPPMPVLSSHSISRQHTSVDVSPIIYFILSTYTCSTQFNTIQSKSMKLTEIRSLQRRVRGRFRRRHCPRPIARDGRRYGSVARQSEHPGIGPFVSFIFLPSSFPCTCVCFVPHTHFGFLDSSTMSQALAFFYWGRGRGKPLDLGSHEGKERRCFE